MKRALGVVVVIALAWALPVTSAVAKGDLVTYAEKEGMEVSAPGPDESVVVFVRPYSTPTAATVYERKDDGSVTLITASYPETYMVHKVVPGKHVFAVVSEAADFIEVDAAGGKIYPIVVTPRMGAWKARFSLLSGCPGSDSWGKMKQWLAGSYSVTPNEAAALWFERHRLSVMEKVHAYWPKWIGKSDRPVVKAEDGVTAF